MANSSIKVHQNIPEVLNPDFYNRLDMETGILGHMIVLMGNHIDIFLCFVVTPYNSFKLSGPNPNGNSSSRRYSLNSV